MFIYVLSSYTLLNYGVILYWCTILLYIDIRLASFYIGFNSTLFYHATSW